MKDDVTIPEIMPAYMKNLLLASHEIYLALEHMRYDNSAKKEKFETLIGIYQDLGDLMNQMQPAEDEEKKG